MITPLPGVTGRQIEQTLLDLASRAANARSGGPEASYAAYVSWAADAAQRLAFQVSAADVDRLVLTQRHWVLQALDPMRQATARLVQLELDERTRDLERSADDLRQELTRWAPGHLVVPDTNVYLHHRQMFTEIDWAAEVEAKPGQGVTVVLPILVVDELDRSKRGRDGIRPRARQTLRALEQLALEPGRVEPLSEPGAAVSVDLRLLVDAPGHVRLTDSDAELVDRSLALANLTDMPVTMFTFDIGMVVRARAAGLSVRLLNDESERTQGGSTS